MISWLRIAQVEAQEVKAEPYNAARFRKVLQQVRSLTSDNDPAAIIRLCAQAGVVIVLVREVKGCRISGATWWVNPARAVIALSDRYKKDDHFWFTFFHEAAHILLHSKKETFVDDDSDDDVLEEDANRFARDLLIPPKEVPHLRKLTSDSDVMDFAREIGIAPGIVVGRLQKDKLWDWSHGNSLKRGLPLFDAQSARPESIR